MKCPASGITDAITFDFWIMSDCTVFCIKYVETCSLIGSDLATFCHLFVADVQRRALRTLLQPCCFILSNVFLQRPKGWSLSELELPIQRLQMDNYHNKNNRTQRRGKCWTLLPTCQNVILYGQSCYLFRARKCNDLIFCFPIKMVVLLLPRSPEHEQTDKTLRWLKC